MSAPSTNVRPRRTKVLIAIGLLIGIVGVVAWAVILATQPQGPIANALKNKTWNMSDGTTTVGRIRFEANGAFRMTQGPNSYDGNWSIENGQLVLDPNNRMARILHRLSGNTPPVARMTVVKTTTDRIGLLNDRKSDVVLTRVPD